MAIGFAACFDKSSADSWAIQEMNDPGAPCTNGDSTYTNRVLVVPSTDTILGIVCWASCDPCVIVPPTGVEDILNSVLIYPNPAKNFIVLEGASIGNSYEIYSVLGTLIDYGKISNSNLSLEVSDLETGVYIISIEADGKSKIYYSGANRPLWVIKGLKGVVLETYGSGNAPNEKWFIKLLKEAIQQVTESQKKLIKK